MITRKAMLEEARKEMNKAGLGYLMDNKSPDEFEYGLDFDHNGREVSVHYDPPKRAWGPGMYLATVDGQEISGLFFGTWNDNIVQDAVREDLQEGGI